MAQPMRVGISRKIISPPKGVYLIGYGDRLTGNRGVHDDLTATALALDDGENRVVIVACDLLAINEITLARVQAEVDEDILLVCSHTHSAPIVYADKKSSRKNQKYIACLVSQLVDAVRASTLNLQPATLHWGSGRADIAVNRRERQPDGSIEIGVNPEGVVDRSMGLVQVRGADGKPLANLVNFSCHNVVLGPKNLLVSADWAGAMRRRVEAATGASCLFIQGATADLNPDHEWGEADFEAVETLGKRVAEGALAAMANLVPLEAVPLKFESSEIWVPLEIEANTPKPPPTYKSVLSNLTKMPRFLVDPILRMRYPWKIQIENRDGFWSIPMSVSILHLGELTWVGLGAEVFNEIGLQVKEMVPTPLAIFSSVTNGCIGYLPTEAEYPLGGYEIDLAPYFYRLPGRLQPTAAAKALQEVEKLVEA